MAELTVPSRSSMAELTVPSRSSMAELTVPSRSSIKLPGGLHRRIDRDSSSSFSAAASSSSSSSSSVVLCGICRQTRFLYTCPRCNVKYCSRLCYQAESHSSCSETFYRECCLQSLGEVGTDDDGRDREKVARMLKEDADARATGEEGGGGGGGEEGEEECVESSTADLSERIGDLDLDDEDDLDRLWNRLKPEERADFEAQLRSGEAADWVLGDGGGGGGVDGDGVGIRTPWWKAPLVVGVEEEEEAATSKNPPRPPRLFSDIKPLSSLTTQKPSPTIPNNLVNVLFAYVYCWRLYNGDHGESAESAAEFLEDFTAICTVVDESRKESFGSVAASLCAAVTRLGGGGEGTGSGFGDDDRHHRLFCSNDFTAAAMEDVSAICAKGRDAAGRAVSDVRTTAAKITAKKEAPKIMTKATAMKKTQSAPHSASDKWKRQKSSTKAIVKKLEFYLSWIVDYGEERLEGLAASAGREALAYRKKMESVRMQSKMMEESGEE